MNLGFLAGSPLFSRSRPMWAMTVLLFCRNFSPHTASNNSSEETTIPCRWQRYQRMENSIGVSCNSLSNREQFRVVYPQLPLDKIHSVEADLVSMITYSELLGLWDPRLSLILGLDSLSPVLFEKHPGRRYQNDINFTDAEVISSEKFAAQLNRQIISAAIDGRLSYKTERGIL